MKYLSLLLILLLLVPTTALAHSPAPDGQMTTQLGRIIAYGETQEGTLNNETHEWRFEGAAGDTVSIALNSDEFDPYLELQDAEGMLLTDNDDGGGELNALIAAFTLPTSGTYIILVRSYGGAATGSYTLSLDTVTLTTPGPINIGDEVLSELDADVHTWTFEGAAGDAVNIAVNSEAIDPRVTLLGPDGMIQVEDDDSGGSLNALIRAYVLPTSGLYTIEVRAFSAGGFGSYTLAVTAATIQQESTLALGDQASGQLSSEAAVWTFEGAEGELIAISVTSDVFDPVMILRGPDSATLKEVDDTGASYDAVLSAYQLPTSGVYTILVRSYWEDESGPYNISLTQPTLDTPGPLTLGQEVFAYLSAESESWTFEASEGDLVSVSLSSPDFDTYVSVSGPDGGVVAENDDSGFGVDSLIGVLAIPASGTYTVNVSSYFSEGGGGYYLTVSPLTLAGTLEPGMEVTGTLEGPSAVYTLTATGGSVVTIALNSNDFDSYLELYDTNNTLLMEDDDSGGDLNSLISEYMLPADATYYVVVRSYGGSGGTYTLTVNVDMPVG